MSVKLLTEHLLEVLSFKEGCTGSSESTLIKMPHCLKSHALAQMYYMFNMPCTIFRKGYIWVQQGKGEQFWISLNQCTLNFLKRQGHIDIILLTKLCRNDPYLAPFDNFSYKWFQGFKMIFGNTLKIIHVWNDLCILKWRFNSHFTRWTSGPWLPACNVFRASLAKTGHAPVTPGMGLIWLGFFQKLLLSNPKHR